MREPKFIRSGDRLTVVVSPDIREPVTVITTDRKHGSTLQRALEEGKLHPDVGGIASIRLTEAEMKFLALTKIYLEHRP